MNSEDKELVGLMFMLFSVVDCVIFGEMLVTYFFELWIIALPMTILGFIMLKIGVDLHVEGINERKMYF